MRFILSAVMLLLLACPAVAAEKAPEVLKKIGLDCAKAKGEGKLELCRDDNVIKTFPVDKDLTLISMAHNQESKKEGDENYVFFYIYDKKADKLTQADLCTEQGCNVAVEDIRGHAQDDFDAKAGVLRSVMKGGCMGLGANYYKLEGTKLNHLKFINRNFCGSTNEGLTLDSREIREFEQSLELRLPTQLDYDNLYYNP